MAKRVKIPGRLESAETGNIVTGADAVMDDEKGKTQVVINSEVNAAIINLAQGKQNVLTFDNAPTEDSPNPVTSAGVYTADKVLSDAIEAILLLIPSAASALNKLVDMQTMNSSIATATASFKGTYNLVSDLHLGVDATHEQIGAALDALSLGADNNDYAFVQVPNSATAPTEISKTERFKFNGTNWLFEYDLNNSGFTSPQWNAINSGVTSLLVGKLSDLPTNAELTALLDGKQDNLTFDNVPTAGSPNPVKSGGVYARNNEIVALINDLDVAKQDVLTFDNAPVEGGSNPVKSGGVYTAISAVQAAIVALDAAKQNVLTFDSTPTLGSPNPVTSSGIKTELNRIDGNITTLNDLYEALTQSALVVVQPTDTWPVASPASKTIYRVVDRVNTPPQNYSDYMWNGTVMVLMATYDNAIDDVPIAGSNNLVKSGGVNNAIANVFDDCTDTNHSTTVNLTTGQEATVKVSGLHIPKGSYVNLIFTGNTLVTYVVIMANDGVILYNGFHMGRNDHFGFFAEYGITDISIYMPAGNVSTGTFTMNVDVISSFADVEQTANIVGVKENVIVTEEQLVNNNTLLVNDGRTATVNNYKTSDYIKLPERAKKMILINAFPLEGYAGLCFYDGLKRFISAGGGTGDFPPAYNEIDLSTVLSQGAAYFRVSSLNSEWPFRAKIMCDYKQNEGVEKNVLIGKKNGFIQGCYDINGALEYFNDPTSEGYKKWKCMRNMINLFNAKKLVIKINTSDVIDVFIYKYSYSIDPTTYEETFTPVERLRVQDTKESVELDVDGWNCYVRISVSGVLYFENNEDFDIDVSVTYKNSFSCDAGEAKMLIETTPNEAGIVGSHIVDALGSGEYTDLGTAYNDNRPDYQSPALTMFIVKNGTYGRLSVVDWWVKGQDRDYTIVANTEAVYPTGAIGVGGGKISNMTFYATNPDTSVRGVYALHCDDAGMVGKKVLYENCRFIADLQSAIGIGLAKDQVMTFKDCIFISNDPNNAAAFFHDARPSLGEGAYGGMQYINFINCLFITKGDYALRILSTDSSNRCIATFEGCTFESRNGNNNAVKCSGVHTEGFLCGNSILLGATSHGNNVELLNA